MGRPKKQRLSSEEAFTLYHRRVQEVRSLEIVNHPNWTRQSWRFRWERGSPAKWEYELPPRDLVRSFLMALRQFLANDERISFHRIAERIRRECNNREMADLVSCLQDDYSHLMRNTTLPMRINHHKLSTEEIINLYFNAELFHSDVDKLPLLDMVRRNDLERDYWYNLVTAAIKLFVVIWQLDVLIQNRGDNDFIQRTLADFRASDS
jgi:hypothetical protein